MAEHSRPTLKQLNKLKKSVSYNWYDLGIELLEPEDLRKLDEIRKDSPGDTSMCCTKMFQLWLDRQLEASWEQLIQALRGIDLDEVANTTKSKLLSINEGDLI